MQQPDEETDPDGASDDEAELFRRAMRGVRPLKVVQRVAPTRRAPRPRARFARAERAEVLRESLGVLPGGSPGRPGTDLYELQPGDELVFRRVGVPQTVLRQLRRGHYRIDSEIDLHGLTVPEAMARLSAFLREARARDLRCIRVIHGKGLRSGTRGPVLKNSVNALLQRADPVLAFASARPVAGGTGATLVLLARS